MYSAQSCMRSETIYAGEGISMKLLLVLARDRLSRAFSISSSSSRSGLEVQADALLLLFSKRLFSHSVERAIGPRRAGLIQALLDSLREI